MSEGLRAIVAAVSSTGHAFPVMALARELHRRGHEVLVQTSERWRDAVEGRGMRFAPGEQPFVLPGTHADGGQGPTLAELTRSRTAIIEEFGPDVVVSDGLTLSSALAADAVGVRRATLIPHPYPAPEPGLPLYLWGMRPPRTPLGSAAWRALSPLAQPALRQGRRALNEARAELGLPPLRRFHGEVSDRLAIVATFPQLEYPRRWPAHVHVTGPMFFELPHPEVELPPGEEPLVLVAGSTVQEPERLVRVTLEALSEEPVRVVATTNRRGEAWSGQVPDNAAVVDWVSYAQVMPRASLVVCSGGHGTVVRALSEGVPVLVSPGGGDQAENGARVAWAGAGLMLPSRLLRPGSLRWAVRSLLSDPRFAARARAIGAWGRENDGAASGAELVERLARAGAAPRDDEGAA